MTYQQLVNKNRNTFRGEMRLNQNMFGFHKTIHILLTRGVFNTESAPMWAAALLVQRMDRASHMQNNHAGHRIRRVAGQIHQLAASSGRGLQLDVWIGQQTGFGDSVGHGHNQGPVFGPMGYFKEQLAGLLRDVTKRKCLGKWRAMRTINGFAIHFQPLANGQQPGHLRLRYDTFGGGADIEQEVSTTASTLNKVMNQRGG